MHEFSDCHNHFLMLSNYVLTPVVPLEENIFYEVLGYLLPSLFELPGSLNVWNLCKSEFYPPSFLVFLIV